MVSKQNFLFSKCFLKSAEISTPMELISYSITMFVLYYVFDEGLRNMKSFQSCINARCVTVQARKEVSKGLKHVQPFGLPALTALLGCIYIGCIKSNASYLFS